MSWFWISQQKERHYLSVEAGSNHSSAEVMLAFAVEAKVGKEATTAIE